MSDKHYHVLGGLSGGYMPDSNEAYKTKKEAQQGLYKLVKIHREAANQAVDYKLRSKDRVTFTGSMKAGAYWSSDNRTVLEISECYEKDCLKELEEQT